MEKVPQSISKAVRAYRKVFVKVKATATCTVMKIDGRAMCIYCIICWSCGFVFNVMYIIVDSKCLLLYCKLCLDFNDKCGMCVHVSHFRTDKP